MNSYLADLDEKIDLESKGKKDYPKWNLTQYDFALRFIPEKLENISSFHRSWTLQMNSS